jgi:hypothetical protein
MPVELLQAPVDVEKESQDVIKPVTEIASQIRNQVVVKTRPEKSLLHKIFQGHEEFLGRTPD